MADQTQRAILEAEFYWFGGQLGAPKVFDVSTNFSARPTLRGPTVDDDADADGDGDGDYSRVFSYRSDGEHWTVTFDEA